jgi:hypothetical protein
VFSVTKNTIHGFLNVGLFTLMEIIVNTEQVSAPPNPHPDASVLPMRYFILNLRFRPAAKTLTLTALVDG